LARVRNGRPRPSHLPSSLFAPVISSSLEQQTSPLSHPIPLSPSITHRRISANPPHRCPLRGRCSRPSLSRPRLHPSLAQRLALVPHSLFPPPLATDRIVPTAVTPPPPPHSFLPLFISDAASLTIPVSGIRPLLPSRPSSCEQVLVRRFSASPEGSRPSSLESICPNQQPWHTTERVRPACVSSFPTSRTNSWDSHI
jgi:hypothetical protein